MGGIDNVLQKCQLYRCRVFLDITSSGPKPQQEEIIRQIERLGGHVLRNKERSVLSIILTGSLVGDYPKYCPNLPAGTLPLKGIYAPRITDEAIEKLDFAAFPDLRSITIDSGNVSDRTLLHLEKLGNLDTIQLSETQITDQGLAKFLRNQRSLDMLLLHHVEITDQGLAAVEKLSHLETLSLLGTKISDDGLKAFKNLDNLAFLGLSYTKVGDGGLKHLTHLQNLSFLSLDKTNITDSGVLHLTTLTKLKRLSIRSTKVTAEGEAILRIALPSLEIIR